MNFTLGLTQCCHPAQDSFQAVLTLAETWCIRAKKAGVDLLAFPESLMTRYEVKRGAFLDAAQPLDGAFCSSMNELARRYELWIAYTANEQNPTGAPFNTAVLVGSDGIRRTSYRKVHLFDSGHTRESDRMTAGDALVQPVETPFGKIGLSICYDLRFPEVARTAALEGCTLLLNPAAWVDGPLKAEQWLTLLAARALENEMFVAGVCRPDSGYIGQSAVFAPDGTLIAKASTNEELLIAPIEAERITTVRKTMPVLQHRRPEMYRL